MSRMLGPLLLTGVIWSAFADDPLPPAEAIEALRARIPMTAEAFFALRQAYRRKGFTIAGVQSVDLIARVQAEIERALEGQVTREQFLAEMPRMFARFGVSPASPHHIETVFINGMQSSYNAGRWSMQTDPDVADLFMWQYDAVDDDRTRPSHRAMDGVTLPSDDAIWTRWYPPNGHRCRCRIITVPVDEAKRTDKRRISRAAPDPGWAGSPGQWLEQP